MESVDFFDPNYDIVIPKLKYDESIIDKFLSFDYDNFSKLVKEFYKIITDNTGLPVKMKYPFGSKKEVVGKIILCLGLIDSNIDENTSFKTLLDNHILGDKILEKIDLIDKSDLLVLNLINYLSCEIIWTTGVNKYKHKIYNKLKNKGRFQ